MISWPQQSQQRQLRKRCKRLKHPEREQGQTVNASRAGEIGFLVSEGYDVWSDELVEQIRQDFLAELPPSIEDHLPQAEINRVLNGEEQVAQVPISAGDWNGISPTAPSRDGSSSGGQFALGCPLRSYGVVLCRLKPKPYELNWRPYGVVEGELQPLRVVTSSVPDLPVGTLVRSSPGTGSNT